MNFSVPKYARLIIRMPGKEPRIIVLKPNSIVLIANKKTFVIDLEFLRGWSFSQKFVYIQSPKIL